MIHMSWIKKLEAFWIDVKKLENFLIKITKMSICKDFRFFERRGGGMRIELFRKSKIWFVEVWFCMIERVWGKIFEFLLFGWKIARKIAKLQNVKFQCFHGISSWESREMNLEVIIKKNRGLIRAEERAEELYELSRRKQGWRFTAGFKS